MALELTLHDNLTAKQRGILKTRANHLILEGPAGTSKTYIALARGLKLLKDGEVERIVIIRSAVEIRSIGYLPGDREEKLEAYMGPYISLVTELSPKRNLKAFISSREMEFHCTSFLRGMTFDDAYVIMDEYQNTNAHELETVITRVGVNTHLVLCGDTDQSDLKYNEAKEHIKVIETLKSMPDFYTVKFGIEDIVRSDFVRRYYEAKAGILSEPALPHFLTA